MEHVCKVVPVLRWDKVFFANTSNPLPEALEGSLCAKETTALREPQGPSFDRCRGVFAKEVPVLRWGEVFLLPQTIAP